MKAPLPKILREGLKELGVKTVVSCPGGRNAALLNELIDSGDFSVESFYDERSAGFYALGKSQTEDRPVAVVVTSGSALAGLYPAALEAAYQKDSKLILISADRPEHYRGTGAPQSIEQKDFFALNYLSTLELKGNVDWKSLKLPLHINIPLPEPSPIQSLASVEQESLLVVISTLQEKDSSRVKESLKSYRGVLLLESLSNLSEKDFPQAMLLSYPEVFLKKVGLETFKRIVKIGGTPLFKSWREIENHPEVYHWEEDLFAGGVGLKKLSLKEIKKLSDDVEVSPSFSKKIENYKEKVEGKMAKYPLSEVAVLQDLARSIPKGAQVFIGNSMPIRNWSYIDSSGFKNLGQRGVNGIDGSLALALGGLSKEKENWIILGDLTTLYNINDFHALKYLADYKIRIVVLNNGGGQIFSRIFNKNKEHFINKQDYSFQDISKIWGIKYLNTYNNLKEQHAVIEVKVDDVKTETFWKRIEDIQI